MVRLSTSTSLLALALATGSAQAFSDEYQRRSELHNNLYGREFIDSQDIPFTREVDLEDLYGREFQDFDDLGAREPQGLFTVAKLALKATGVGKNVLKSVVSRISNSGKNHHHRREFIDSQEIPFSRGFQDFDNLEALEPKSLASSVFRGTLRLVGEEAAGHAVSRIFSHNQEDRRGHVRRGLEAEEPFGREYYELDERDIFDDLD